MQFLRTALSLRFLPLTLSAVMAAAVLIEMLAAPRTVSLLLLPFLLFAALTWLGIHDMRQKKSSILRNYPIAGHGRFLLEELRPKIRQYFFEGEKDGRPFPRDKRSLVYQRAKGQLDKRPFGTEFDVYESNYEWISHSLSPTTIVSHDFRVTVGGPDCRKPYSASVLNISAMSFGALSANAIRALNKGAKMGNFAHDTGVGGGMLRGLQDTRVPLILGGIGYWLVGMPMGLALAFAGGMEGRGIWLGLAAGLAFVAVTLMWRWVKVTGRLDNLLADGAKP